MEEFTGTDYEVPGITQSELEGIHLKLDEILEFQRELRPYLHLLEKLSAFADNPASRFKDVVRLRKAMKAPGFKEQAVGIWDWRSDEPAD